MSEWWRESWLILLCTLIAPALIVLLWLTLYFTVG